MTYVDAFIVSVTKDKLDDYRKILPESAALWKEHGAIGYVETLGDDVPYGELTSFPRAVQAKDDEVVVLSWVLYASRADRDRVSKAAMADPRMDKIMQNQPVDGKRMIWGGFEVIHES